MDTQASRKTDRNKDHGGKRHLHHQSLKETQQSSGKIEKPTETSKTKLGDGNGCVSSVREDHCAGVIVCAVADAQLVQGQVYSSQPHLYTDTGARLGTIGNPHNRQHAQN